MKNTDETYKKFYNPFWIHALGESIELLLIAILCLIAGAIYMGKDEINKDFLMIVWFSLGFWFLLSLKLFWFHFSQFTKEKSNTLNKHGSLLNFWLKKKPSKTCESKKTK